MTASEERPVLRGASSGQSVRVVQEALAELGYALGRIDGVYGPRTAEAVMEYQRGSRRLHADGVVGNDTWTALGRDSGYDGFARPLRTPLNVASTGPDVVELQALLRRAGYPVTPDGVFGPSTDRAVVALQRAHGIAADGVVGPDTWAALLSAEPEPRVTAPEPSDPSSQRAAQSGSPGFTLDAAAVLYMATALHRGRSPWAVDVVVAALSWSIRPTGTDSRILGMLADAMQQYGWAAPEEMPDNPVTVRVPAWILEEAGRVLHAVERRDDALIDVRHLLAAAVTGRGTRHVEGFLARLTAPPELLRLQLLEAVFLFRPPDEAPYWRTVLDVGATAEDAPAVLGGGYSSDYVPIRPTEPLTDRLGVDVYVRMLALLVADRRTPMPLSIGLFAEWGAGKSYFMGLLRQAVSELAADGASRDDSEYHSDIVQITFNAWHYSDANLWASLADEIFEQLAGPAAAAEGDDEERRRRIRADLTKTMQQRKELEDRTASAQVEVADLRHQVQIAQGERDDSKAALFRSLVADPAVREPLDKAARALGLDDDARTRFRDLAREARGARSDVTTAWRYVVARSWTATFVALVVFVALVSLAPQFTGWARGWLDVGALTVAAGYAGRTLTGVRTARRGLASLRAAADAAERIEREAATAEGKDVSEEAQRLREAEAQLDTLTAQLDEVIGRVGELGRELAELSAGHRLYRFIAQRAASDDYRRHLGIVSTIRRDFERLVDLMAQWRTERATGSEGGEPPPQPIDRIVLYIDDLDRCSAEQVVDVLQAVHLLLAMDLFVVVLGVDPRWLLRALRQQYAGILAVDAEANALESTPHDYLEKIFNIPFALPRMTPQSYLSLLTGIVGRPEPDGDETTFVTTPDRTADVLTPPEPEPESEIEISFRPDVPVTVTAVTPDELAYLAELATVVRTPRSVTRMVNVYRMLRATRDLSPDSTFLGADGSGEYRVVAQLLTILTAYPRVLGPLLFTPAAAGTSGGLVYRDPASSWHDFVAGLAVEDGANDVLAAVPASDVAMWNDVARSLIAWAPRLGDDVDVAVFQRWAAHVARFSFQPAQAAIR